MPSAIAEAREEWDSLAARVVPTPYLAWGWLESWADVYLPRRLLLLRIMDPGGAVVALGLIEECRFGVLRFAGAPVTPVRGLMCAPADEAEAWRSVDAWLTERLNWSLLNGVAAGDCDLPAAVLTPAPWYRVELPDTFEEFLSTRAPARRREFRRRLRVAEREGLVTRVLMGDAAREGIEAFARLHTARAHTKGERHKVIDERLVAMLCGIADRGTPELRVRVVERDGVAIGVGVQTDNGRETWAYNTGFDPAAAQLSPGLVVRLESIRDSIERSVTRLDLGPGDFAYKLDFGGEAFDRVKVDISNRSLSGRLMRERVLSEHRLRNAQLLRTGVMRWRALRGARHARASDNGQA
jgi:CelD/BcsL family acetyltransferase involved in cellulose biosynthesis